MVSTYDSCFLLVLGLLVATRFEISLQLYQIVSRSWSYLVTTFCELNRWWSLQVKFFCVTRSINLSSITPSHCIPDIYLDFMLLLIKSLLLYIIIRSRSLKVQSCTDPRLLNVSSSFHQSLICIGNSKMTRINSYKYVTVFYDVRYTWAMEILSNSCYPHSNLKPV